LRRLAPGLVQEGLAALILALRDWIVKLKG